LAVLFRYVVAERMGVILLSALVAHTAWHWMIERASLLGQYQFQWPALDGALLVSLMRGLLGIAVLVGVLWALYGLFGGLSRPECAAPVTPGRCPRRPSRKSGLDARCPICSNTSAPRCPRTAPEA